MPRVSYIWSRELQDAADQLPSNIGRSSVVHDLIDSLGLLEKSIRPDHEGRVSESDRGGYRAMRHSNSKARAKVVPPDKALGTAEMLKRYHDSKYVDYLMNTLRHSGQEDESSGSESDGSASDSSCSESDRPAKRRRTEHGLEYDCPPFPSLAQYAQLVVSATTTACRLLVDGQAEIGIVWDGGRHHALRNRASGFCYVADVVLGVMYLTKHGKARAQHSGLEEPSRPLRVEDGRTSLGPADNGHFHLEPTSEPLLKAGLGESPDVDKGSIDDDIGQEQATASDTAPTGEPMETAVEVRHEDKTKSIKTRRPRVMYLDLDIHEGDGVHQAFLSPSHFPTDLAASTFTTSKPKKTPRPPQVLTLSIHHHAPTFFPPHRPFSALPSIDTPHPFTLSIPLHAYPSPDTYVEIWPSVEKVKEAFDPDYVVLQLGVDGLPGDRVGQYGAWAIGGRGGVGWCVDQVKAWGLRMVVLGGGGYDHANAARAWAMATSIMLDRPLAEDEPVPHHDHFPLYAPSFTLEIPPSHAKDENTVESIAKINEVFEAIADRIKGILAVHA